MESTKSAAVKQLAGSLNSNAKLPGLWLTQRRIKTPEQASKTLAVQAKGPPEAVAE